jgi:hypothetical protein
VKSFITIALLFAGVAQAQVAWNENRIEWTAHTSCTDGQPASACPVTDYRVERASSQSGTFTQIATTTTLTYTHIAQAGTNCYRVRSNSAGGFSGYTNVACRTNVEPPPPTPVPNPPTNLRFVTVSATNHPDTDWTPAFRISGSTAGTMLALVPVGRQTQSAPLFNYRGKPYCRVEVGLKELTGTTDPRNLAAPCGPA